MQLRLVDKFNVTEDVVTFVWEAPEPMEWRAGQFLKYVLPHENVDDRGTSRWFTIAAAPYEGKPRITTRFASERSSSFKSTLHNLKVGDTIEATRPAGDFVIEDPAKNFVFIAGGIGITPYRAILLQLDHDGIDIHGRLLYANRNDQYVFQNEFENIAAKHPSFTIEYFTDPRHIELEDIQRSASTLTDPIYFLSGPEPMIENYKVKLTSTGIAEASIKADYFPGYGTI